MASTVPGSSGWITLARPAISTLPGATARTSSRPKKDQQSARAKKAQIVSIRTTGKGDEGVSRISRAAGKNSRSRRGILDARRRWAGVGTGGGVRAFMITPSPDQIEGPKASHRAHPRRAAPHGIHFRQSRHYAV